MEQLELVRVHDSGEKLILRAPDGSEYVLPVDKELRAAVAKARPAGSPGPSASTFTPRQIQARIREGATADEVAQESGIPLESVLRYEGPVLAERDYIARQALAVEVSTPLGHEGYRAAFGDEPASLGQMVRIRLRAFGVDPASLRWDAWKVDAGTWKVFAHFTAPQSATSVGEEPPAVWTFHPSRKHLENTNRWSQVLSEWEPWDVLPSQRRLVAVSDRPFDVEAGEGDEKGSGAQRGATGAPAAGRPAPVREGRGTTERPAEDRPSPGQSGHDEAEEPPSLLDVLSRRRGTRVGEDVDGDDELAHLIARKHRDRERSGQADAEAPGRTDGLNQPPSPERSRNRPASELRDSDRARTTPGHEDPAEPSWNQPGGAPSGMAPGSRGSGTRSPEGRTPGSGASDGVWPPLRRVPDPIPATRREDPEHEGEDSRTHRKRRSQVPSWDEIVFGRSARDDEEDD